MLRNPPEIVLSAAGLFKASLRIPAAPKQDLSRDSTPQASDTKHLNTSADRQRLRQFLFGYAHKPPQILYNRINAALVF